MKQQNYTASHENVRVSARRFQNSPYLEKYATDDMLYGIYAKRLHVLTLGEDHVEHYWKLRRDVALFDVLGWTGFVARVCDIELSGGLGFCFFAAD